MEIRKPTLSSVQGLTEVQIDALIEEFGAGEIADLLDKAFVKSTSTLHFKESAADMITALVMGNVTPLTGAVIAAATGKTRDEVAKLPFFQRGIALYQVAKLTFPNASPPVVGQMLMEKVLAAAAKTSVVASGNLTSQ